MIEPLYRIWDIEAQKFANAIEPYYLYINGTLEHYMFEVQQDQYIIQRCTGEQDVNGKYIYEGDIVHDITNSNYTVQSTILFAWGNFVIKSLHSEDMFDSNLKLKVVGNILENSDLILERSEE